MAKPLISKKRQKEIAKERIDILMKKADSIFKNNKQLANRYVTLSRKIAMKVRMRFPQEHKRKFCKHCKKYLKSGKNSRTRTRDGKVIITCFECKKFTRIPIK